MVLRDNKIDLIVNEGHFVVRNGLFCDMKIVVLSGAGISAESGIATFRDSNGLWEGHDVMEVASPQGWSRNKELVLDFYNQRRKNAFDAKPNLAHIALHELERAHEVVVITQNVDNLHERAGSSNVLHLHGELFKSQSTANPRLVYEMDSLHINLGDRCELGSQLRPFIVWFGEAVPKIEEAIEEVIGADVMIVVGTSLNVYPAAGLIGYMQEDKKIYVVDPNLPEINNKNIVGIRDKATSGIPKVVKELSM